ncbi:hypothetical protein C2G38_2191192 [Gigaspora rosea]|uniref:Uncharacterized protein n=1 Tax=Gigaspora rosea TaxID=44941 RepID=A0A397V0H5_9GLOM|nr:hypothetical protein C2G38_2191192 [Gigaspora rosea]
MPIGRPPHYDIEYDETLAIQICNGLRPEFAKGTSKSKCYIQLADQSDAIVPTLSTPLSICHYDKAAQL